MDAARRLETRKFPCSAPAVGLNTTIMTMTTTKNTMMMIVLVVLAMITVVAVQQRNDAGPPHGTAV